MPTPPLEIPAGYAECAFVHQQNDTLQLGICTLGVNTDDPTVLLQIGDLWQTDMLAEMNNSWTYIQFRGTVTGGLIAVKDYLQPGAGGGSGTSPQVSYLFKKHTLVAGRAYRGRMYYPGCDETSVDADGRVESGKVTGLANMVTAFVSDLGALTPPVVPYILHREPKSGPPTPAPTAINSILPENIVATQRRRLAR